MRRAVFTTLLLLCVFLQPRAAASPVTLLKIRHGSHAGYARVVLDLSAPAAYEVSRPAAAILIALPGVVPAEDLRIAPIQDAILEKVEWVARADGGIDVAVTPRHQNAFKIFALEDPARLVMDLYATPAASSAPSPSAVRPPVIGTIMIDPGHGGKDPGTIGARGLAEKEVVLDVSLRLRALIQRHLKRKVILTRSTDVFIPLEGRARMANLKAADLFISIHANASPDAQVRGIETYLFGRATDAGASAAAARENAEVEKTTLDFQKMILNDMKRDFVLNAALEWAHFTQEAFSKGLIPRHKTISLGVKRAPFYVLAKTQMPAILAEISFLSHSGEEALLGKDAYRQAIAEALLDGISAYLRTLEAGQ